MHVLQQQAPRAVTRHQQQCRDAVDDVDDDDDDDDDDQASRPPSSDSTQCRRTQLHPPSTHERTASSSSLRDM